jgi:hypothetical protein
MKLGMYTKRFILALLIIVGCFSYVFIVTLIPEAKTNDFISGVLMTGGFTVLISFYFGSSDNKGKNNSEKEIE